MIVFIPQKFTYYSISYNNLRAMGHFDRGEWFLVNFNTLQVLKSVQHFQKELFLNTLKHIQKISI